MTKLVFNMNSLNKEVMPYLDSTIEKLDTVIRNGSQIYIPSDFQYAYTLRQMLDANSSTRKELVSIKNWIANTNKVFDDSMREIEAKCQAIKNLEIPKRESAIK